MSALFALTPAGQAPVESVANIEAEQAILGAIFVNNEAFGRVADFLKPEHFSEELHRRIYEIAGQLIRAGKLATPVTLKTFVGEFDLGGSMTVPQYLARLAAEATTVINAVDYGRAIHDLAARRAIIERAGALIQAARNPEVDQTALELLQQYDDEMNAVRDSLGKIAKGAISIGAAVQQVLESVTKARNGEDDSTINTGLHQLNKRLGGGWRRGRLYVFGGRPGMGKTVIGTSLAYKAAKRGAGVGIFSLEIDEAETAARMVSAHYGGDQYLNYSAVLGGKLNDGDHQLVVDAQRELEHFPIEIDCTSGLTIAQIETRARGMDARLRRKGFGLDLLVIDYLGLVKVADRYKGNRVAELGDVVLAAKNLSKTLDCAVVLFAQLSRGVEQRDDKRPMMSDLRDSGNIEEHADAIGLLYRPAYYDERLKRLHALSAVHKLPDNFDADAFTRRHDLEIIFDKNRLGETGTDVLHCQPGRSFVTHGRTDA